jgi:hypothetical protein
MAVRRGRRHLALTAITAGLLSLGATPAASQLASLTATAQVDATVLSVLNVSNLEFGSVPPGVATTVDPKTAANAGKFEIRGTSGAEISVTLALPTQLVVGPWSMPLSFGSQGACYRNRDQQPQCAYFDPSASLVTRIRNRKFPDNLLIVWVGGTVNPALTQFPGVYHASVLLTAAYTGN